jgi:homogentisate 1,2-dioxygenase
MTDLSPSRPMVQDQRSQGTHPGYMPGFGNDFETEALPDALPQGMNSPQKCNYGLYGEQLSGTAFTAPSHQNERTWCYRIRPSVKHSPALQKIDLPYWKSRRTCPADVISLGQYRWDPVPHSDEPLTWLTGMRTMTTAGDVNTQVGMASHIYLVTASMEDAYFYSADSELLIVPQEGQAALLHRARHHRPGAAGDRDHPARLLYRVEVPRAPRAASSARITARSSSCPAADRSAPTAWPTGATSRRRSRPSRTARCRRPSP